MAYRLPPDSGRNSAHMSNSESNRAIKAQNRPPQGGVSGMLTRPIMPSDQRGRETIGERSRNSLIRSEVQSEAISPLLSPDIRRTKARQAVRSRNFFRQDNDNRLGSQSQLSSLQSPHLGHYLPNWQREWGKRSSNHTIIEDSFRNTSLNEEYARLTAALESQKRALSGLKLKRSQTLGISEGKSEAAVLRLIEVSRLQRLKKSFQARYYTASQKIENTKRRISKIKNGFKVKEGKQSTDQEYSFYKNCSETQLRELLDCERLEFKAKLEFEISFNELLSKKLAKLESLEQSKSLILRIIDDRVVQKEGEFTKVFEKMRENKNTMTTEKIVMINKPSLSQQNIEHSAGILLHDKGESEQTYNPPKVGNLTFSNKRIAVKVLPEIKVSHHKRTYSEDIPRDNFLAVRPAEAEHRHFQKENDSNSTYYLDNEASVYEDIYGQMDQSPKASPQKSRPLSRERIPESQHLTSYQEIPPFQRKRLEFSVSKNNLNETLLGNDPSIDISHVNRGTNLSLTYLPAIRVQSPSMKKPFGPSDRYSSSDLKNDKSNSSQKLEPLSKKTLILIPNSSAGKDQLQLPLHSRDLDDDPPEFSPHYTPKKQPQKTIFKEDRPQDLVSSARERMVNKIQRFLPDNPSIEERMVESSKRSVQEPEVKRLSQLGQTSGSNENSSLRNNDKTDNMNLTKISDGNASQPANPSLPLPTIQETGDKSPKKERKNENSGTLIKHFASPMSPGPTFIKGKLLQARRSEGPLTNRQTIKAFQAKNSSRRVSPSLTIAGKSANQQPMFSPQMKDLFSRPENEPGSKDTPPDSSQKEDSKVTPPQLKPQKGSSDELDLYSHRSEIEPSRASDPLSKDNRADPFHSGLNKANKNKVRPDWKSEDESEMRFITYSDD